MVYFESIGDDEFPQYWKYSIESWMHDMQKAGFLDEDTTYEEAEKQVRKFLPDGLKTSGHHIMHILDNHELVGNIWFEIRGRRVKEAYLWDIIIFEGYRGKGYGRKSLTELEGLARKEGAKKVSLNVFAYNIIARRLYQSSGYSDAAITMIKYL